MSTILWTLIPNQYERDIYLVLSDDSFYNIVKLLNKKYEFDWEEDTDFSKNDNITPPCTISNGNKFKIAIILDKFDGTSKCYSTLAHEIYHVMTLIAQATGAEMIDEASEHWAYFLSFYMDMCAQSLNEHIKKNK